ncbi:MAG: DUF3795 domain-containing protein [Erysipelotrichaceae bacterium]|nr:DUF3795 domain-containing protein [Erysipelotrichaceae bacterium]
MKREFVAFCGLDCETCEARIATVNNDQALRERVASEWSQLNQVTITHEMINCVGCRIDGVKTPFCDTLCPIRQCALNKEVETCIDCDLFDECEKLAMITDNNKDALLRLKGLKQQINQ